VDTTEFRGTLAVNDYMLNPRSGDWTGTGRPKNGVRSFQSSDAEAVGLAMRALLESPSETGQNPATYAKNPPILPARKHGKPYGLSDFDHATPLSDAGYSENHPFPDTWITVIGRDGYWPLAVLDDKATESLKRRSVARSNSDQTNVAKPQETVAILPNDEHKRKDCNQPSSARNVPVPWAILTLISIGILSFHVFGCWNLSWLRLIAMDDAFRQRTELWWRILFGLSGALAVLPLACLTMPWLAWALIVKDFPSCLHCGPPGYLRMLIIAICGGSGVCLSLVARRRMSSSSADISPDLVELFIFLSATLILGCLLFLGQWHGLTVVDAETYWSRAVHITNGVSPLLPLWLLLVGLYFWSLQSLKGNGLLTDGMPKLPKAMSAEQTRISATMAERIERAARVFSPAIELYLPTTVVVTGFVTLALLQHDWPVNTFEQNWAERLFNLSLLLALLIAVQDATQLVATWAQVKCLLNALSRTPLRRTFLALRDISIRSLWAMGANVSQSQYHFFLQQLDVAETLLKAHSRTRVEQLDVDRHALVDMVNCGYRFRLECSESLDRSAQWSGAANANQGSRKIREAIQDCTMALLATLEVAWRMELPERTSRDLGTGDSRRNGEHEEYFHLSNNSLVCWAEEFVCLTYISYIQNALARIRSLVFSIGILFVTAALSLAVYPFSPKPAITTIMMVLLFGFAIAVGMVFSGMERDRILSDITNTDPVLSWEFYGKFATFLVPTILALLTTQFPELTDSILSWLEPGLNAIK
jgi:hypothetical protein